MKKIAILGDTIASGNVFGIQRFAYEILREIDRLALSFEVLLVVPEYVTVNIHFDKIRIIKFGNIKNAFLWRQICFPEFVRKNHCISVDMTLGMPYLGCDVVCLHDCTYENYPDNFVTFKEKLKRKSYLIRAKKLTHKAQRIVTVSQHSKEDLINYYKISPTKIDIIYNAWQHYERIKADTTILDRFNLRTQSYYFSLGSGLKHKNLLWIVNAAIKNPECLFVVTGSDKFSNYLSNIGLKDIKNIIYTGYLADEEVKGLMENCKAFIHPAFCEGFGIPPLEALSCGAEILVSKESCLPEIYEDAALYLDPYDYEIDMNQFQEFPSSEKRARILNKYSWAISAQKFIEIINKI